MNGTLEVRFEDVRVICDKLTWLRSFVSNRARDDNALRAVDEIERLLGLAALEKIQKTAPMKEPGRG